MSKTTSLEIECDNVTIGGNRYQRLQLTIEGPASVNEILNGIDEDDMNQWIASNRNPEDIFSITDLQKWAESEGYTKE